MAEQKPYTLGDYFAVLRRRWVYPAVFLPGGILVALYLAFTLTPTYQSSATLMLELSSIPKELIKTSVEAAANQEVELVRRRVMSTENLEALTKEIDPYPNRPDLDSPRAKARQISADTEVERVDPVTLKPLLLSNAFSIYYNNESPEIAQAVTDKLAELFLKSNRDERTSPPNRRTSSCRLRQRKRATESAISSARSRRSKRNTVTRCPRRRRTTKARSTVSTKTSTI